MNEFVFSDMTGGIKLESDLSPDLSALSDNELDVLKAVCEQFKDISAGKISEISHQEAGWKANVDAKACIDYSYAYQLSIK